MALCLFLWGRISPWILGWHLLTVEARKSWWFPSPVSELVLRSRGRDIGLLYRCWNLISSLQSAIIFNCSAISTSLPLETFKTSNNFSYFFSYKLPNSPARPCHVIGNMIYRQAILESFVARLQSCLVCVRFLPCELEMTLVSAFLLCWH